MTSVSAVPVVWERAAKWLAVRRLVRALRVTADTEQLRANLGGHCSVESLRWLRGVLVRGGEPAHDLRHRLTRRYFLKAAVNGLDMAGVEREMRNNLLFRSLLGECSYSDVNSLVWGLSLSEKFNKADFAKLKEGELAGCVAAMRAARELAGSYPVTVGDESPVRIWRLVANNHVACVLNEPLLSFVVDNPGEVELIVAKVLEHEVLDPAVLRGLISGAVLPLAGGAL